MDRDRPHDVGREVLMVAIYIGDRVRTPDGEGYVEEVTTWRDRLVELNEAEAREFAAQCRRESGPDYRRIWGRVLVRVGKRVRRYPLVQITVLEGRDGNLG